MSRVIVKNLPKNATDQSLRNLFDRVCDGQVTEVFIPRNKSGKSRQFAFIGFKEAKTAGIAIAKLNKSFIGACKISVELATPPNATSRPEKRKDDYAVVNVKNDEIEEDEEEDNAEEKAKKKEKVEKDLKEFLSVNQPRNAKSAEKFWSNDDVLARQQNNADSLEESSNNFSEKLVFDDDSGSSDEEDLPLIEQDEEEDGDAENQETKSDSEEDKIDIHDTETQAKPEKLQDGDLFESGRLFIRNLPYSTNEDDVKELFSKFGEIDEIHLPLDDLKRTKGFAFVRYSSPEDAVKALAETDNQVFQGRILHVLPSKPEPKKTAFESQETSSYKRKKEELLKKQSGNQDTWNSLFLRTDTVMQSIADKYGVSKSDIVNPHSLGEQEEKKAVPLAVKVALAETEMITETRSFFVEHGIVPNVFDSEGKIERSNSTMIVKNLPNGVEDMDLRRLFGKFGELGRVLLPPSKAIAIVEFLEPSEAKRAFSGLAYSKFKDVPLFLEWAPTKLFAAKFSDSQSQAHANEERSNANNVQAEEKVSQEVKEEVSSGSTLFVKNLNFGTTEEKLLSAFKKVGSVRKVTIVKKRKNGEMVSMGYGFIEFANPEAAFEALKKMQGFQLNGHRIELKVSSKSEDASNSKSKRKREELHENIDKTKIIVKNLPFEANKSELRSLFGTFGQLKCVRIPKKFDGHNRGFAFIEFVTEKEAENAFNSLRDTHFYGRHLVLQWASAQDQEANNEIYESFNKLSSAAAAAEEESNNESSNVESFPRRIKRVHV